MKTKTFFVLCLLSGLGLTQLFAQNGKNGTGSITYEYVWTPDYCVPVYNSNGVKVDILGQGTVFFHHVSHFVNWVEIWGKCKGFGEAISVGFEDDYGNIIVGTGEVFRVQEIDKCDLTEMLGVCHVNLIGNQGSHYIETFLIDPVTGELIFVSAISVGNNK